MYHPAYCMAHPYYIDSIFNAEWFLTMTQPQKSVGIRVVISGENTIMGRQMEIVSEWSTRSRVRVNVHIDVRVAARGKQNAPCINGKVESLTPEEPCTLGISPRGRKQRTEHWEGKGRRKERGDLATVWYAVQFPGSRKWRSVMRNRYEKAWGHLPLNWWKRLTDMVRWRFNAFCISSFYQKREGCWILFLQFSFLLYMPQHNPIRGLTYHAPILFFLFDPLKHADLHLKSSTQQARLIDCKIKIVNSWKKVPTHFRACQYSKRCWNAFRFIKLWSRSHIIPSVMLWLTLCCCSFHQQCHLLIICDNEDIHGAGLRLPVFCGQCSA